ncbi:MAG: cupin domain-containing protein, partial [Acidobacteriota bacterium]|nr:cupin domain-containing protein [Acidobacteriota bacterium]
MNEETKTKATHVKWGELPVETLNPLLQRQIAVGDRMMVARVLLKKGCVVPMHHHHNEQVTYVESGALHFTVSSEEITVRSGEFL